jgi:hypothetical protein
MAAGLLIKAAALLPPARPSGDNESVFALNRFATKGEEDDVGVIWHQIDLVNTMQNSRDFLLRDKAGLSSSSPPRPVVSPRNNGSCAELRCSSRENFASRPCRVVYGT